MSSLNNKRRRTPSKQRAAVEIAMTKKVAAMRIGRR
jgi:hypothetical protein